MNNFQSAFPRQRDLHPGFMVYRLVIQRGNTVLS